MLSLIGHVLDEVKILQGFKLEATRNDFASLEQKLRVVQQPQFAAQELQVWSRTAILWQKLMETMDCNYCTLIVWNPKHKEGLQKNERILKK